MTHKVGNLYHLSNHSYQLLFLVQIESHKVTLITIDDGNRWSNNKIDVNDINEISDEELRKISDKIDIKDLELISNLKEDKDLLKVILDHKDRFNTRIHNERFNLRDRLPTPKINKTKSFKVGDIVKIIKNPTDWHINWGCLVETKGIIHKIHDDYFTININNKYGWIKNDKYYWNMDKTSIERV